MVDVTKNVFYWSRVAIVVAQGSGMHRRSVNSRTSFLRPPADSVQRRRVAAEPFR